jgi:hypothetical protein
VIRQFGLSMDEFVDSAESATFAANAQMLTKTAVEGIRANWVSAVRRAGWGRALVLTPATHIIRALLTM